MFSDLGTLQFTIFKIRQGTKIEYVWTLFSRNCAVW